MLHLADATAAAVKAAGITQIALLGTALTMESAFYKERLEAAGLRVIIPDEDHRAFMTEAIYTQLVKGQVRPAVRSRFAAILEDVKDKGAQGAILGCTELTLLDLAEFSTLPLFDTVDIHVAAALQKALS